MIVYTCSYMILASHAVALEEVLLLCTTLTATRQSINMQSSLRHAPELELQHSTAMRTCSLTESGLVHSSTPASREQRNVTGAS